LAWTPQSIEPPSVIVKLEIDPMRQATLAEVEAAALIAASELLSRLAREGQAGLLKARETAIANALKP
jgi:hypothetical protein